MREDAVNGLIQYWAICLIEWSLSYRQPKYIL